MIQIRPSDSTAYYNSANLLKDLKRYEEALAFYDKALALNPEYLTAYLNRSALLYDMRRLDEALEGFDRAIAIKPDYIDAINNRGVLLQELERNEEAAACYDQVIALNPNYIEVYSNRGVLLQNLQRFEESLASYDKAIALNPNYSDAYSNRGNVLKYLNRYEEALESLDKAIALNPQSSNAYSNRGIVLKELMRHSEALASYQRAIEINPNYAEAYSNMGNLLKDMRDWEGAIHCYEQAVLIKPDYASAVFNKSLALLTMGDFENGWKLYEYRWQTNQLKSSKRYFRQPLWLNDQDIKGKTILLYSEQGLGDSVQFCRYVPMVQALGAKVILGLPPQLMTWFEQLENTIITDGAKMPEFDVQCPMLSLPLAFKTDLNSIPNQVPYLHADLIKAQAWQSRLSTHQRLKVGLVWNGGYRADSPDHWGVNDKRNIPIAQFAQALSHIDVDFFSLQKGDPAESEIRGQELRYFPQGNLHNHAHELKDFSDTAALVSCLDLVITVDTAVAHLAGAMGKPTWMLNRWDTDWRWLDAREDSPWYPTMKLYRQDRDKQWQPVLERVSQDLSALA